MLMEPVSPIIVLYKCDSLFLVGMLCCVVVFMCAYVGCFSVVCVYVCEWLLCLIHDVLLTLSETSLRLP